MNFSLIDPYLASKKSISDDTFQTFALANNFSTESIRPKDEEIKQLKKAFPELGVKIYSLALKWTPRHLSSKNDYSIGEYETQTDIFAPSNKHSYAVLPLSTSNLTDVHIHVKPDTFRLFGITMGKERPQGKNLLTISPEFDTHYAVYAPAEHEAATKQLLTPEIQQEFLRIRASLPFKHDHLKFISATVYNGTLFLLSRGVRLNNPFMLQSMVSLTSLFSESKSSNALSH